MVSKEIGIRGHLGEQIVHIWLKEVVYSGEDYKIVSQIMPDEKDFSKRGGPYLDIAVVKGNKVHAIYEVKTQDYSALSLNRALVYFWDHHGQIITCKIQNDEIKYETLETTKSYVIVLIAPSQIFFKDEEKSPQKHSMIFFHDILKKLDEKGLKYIDLIMSDIRQDVKKELKERWEQLFNYYAKNMPKLQDQEIIKRL